MGKLVVLMIASFVIGTGCATTHAPQTQRVAGWELKPGQHKCEHYRWMHGTSCIGYKMRKRMEQMRADGRCVDRKTVVKKGNTTTTRILTECK